MRVWTFILGAVSYVLIVFPFAVLWHLVVFKDIYGRLGYFGQQEPILALGFLVIVVQGFVLSSAYPFFYHGGNPVKEGLRFGLMSGLFLWSSQVVAAAAKHHAPPVPTWFAIETAYFAIQFALVGLALGLIFGRRSSRAVAPAS